MIEIGWMFEGCCMMVVGCDLENDELWSVMYGCVGVGVV